jgi:aspartate aminotransferase
VVTLTGVSKSYAMTGWRIGFLAGPAALMKAAAVVQATATSGVSSVGQAAALAALEGPQRFLVERSAAYQARRDLVVAALRVIPGMVCHEPAGAFYVFPDVSAFFGRRTPGGVVIADDAGFATALLNEAHVAVVQGSAFAAPGFVRVSTATDDATLMAACGRIAAFCAGLS